MKQLNCAALNDRISQIDKRMELVNYIFEVQGADLRRLNYKAAANALGVSARTISRYVDELGAKQILTFEDKKLKLNDDILTVS